MTETYLAGKSAIVTGGASGMGRAIALSLARRGANVAIGSYLKKHDSDPSHPENIDTYLPTTDELVQTVDELRSIGIMAVGQHHDLGSTESCKSLVDNAVNAFGQIDILCNVAGVWISSSICDHNEEDWNYVIDTNLSGYYRMIKLVFPDMMRSGWGRIINIASTAANIGAEGNAAYCAAKAGILGLTRCVALEGASSGITANAINPGFTDTDLCRISFDTLAEQDQENKTARQLITETEHFIPQKRMVSTTEIAALATFLCHNDAQSLNMEDITMAGGALW
jgi:NAD(P)-dependent dehydrogenase (short-subunit alcohol dehydrogenase family)